MVSEALIEANIEGDNTDAAATAVALFLRKERLDVFMVFEFKSSELCYFQRVPRFDFRQDKCKYINLFEQV